MTRRVYFVGAGFSKALNSGYPTLFELSEAATQSFKNRYPIGALSEHFDQLPIGLSRNAEHLLSYLISDWPWKSSVEKDLDGAVYKAFVYEISCVLAIIEDQPLASPLQELIQFLFSDDKNTIVSLNYDFLPQHLNALYSRPEIDQELGDLAMHIEYRYQTARTTNAKTPCLVETLEDNTKRLIVSRDWLASVGQNEFLKVVTDAGYVKVSGLGNRNFTFYTPIEVLKIHQEPVPHSLATHWAPSVGKVIHLHGSMLWKDKTGASTIRIKDPDGYTHSEDIPAIVPPVLDESHHYAASRIRDQWEQAHNAIQRADEIVVIGFSFPPTDMSCQFLFKSAIKAGLRVVVVNRDQNVKAAYDSVFEGIPGINLDYAFTGGDDPLTRYTLTEILRIGPEL